MSLRLVQHFLTAQLLPLSSSRVGNTKAALTMMPVLRMCVSQEEMWGASALECARTGVNNLSVSERRMQTAGRTTLLKVERGKGLRLPTLKWRRLIRYHRPNLDLAYGPVFRVTSDLAACWLQLFGSPGIATLLVELPWTRALCRYV